MKSSTPPAPPTLVADLGPPPLAYQRLQAQLRQLGWVCHGTVVCRPLIRRVAGRTVKKGPYYLWTCKVNGRTVCRSLSQAQHQVLIQAIENNRQLQKILQQMQALTLKTILKKVPGVRKRK